MNIIVLIKMHPVPLYEPKMVKLDKTSTCDHSMFQLNKFLYDRRSFTPRFNEHLFFTSDTSSGGSYQVPESSGWNIHGFHVTSFDQSDSQKLVGGRIRNDLQCMYSTCTPFSCTRSWLDPSTNMYIMKFHINFLILILRLKL